MLFEASILYPPPKERKTDHISGLFSFGRGIGIRTPKYRVRVCCVTVTPFPYLILAKPFAFRAYIYYHKKLVLSIAFLKKT